MSGAPRSQPPGPGIPPEPWGRLFLRFLRFGLLAWGGPVAQIAMIRQELVEEARWVSRERFNRVLAVYQVLPGPEAHELCVYFGMLARGRLGGLLAGLGFMLPGFLLMFGLSALYAAGVRAPLWQAVFLGMQPAVVALVVRAVHRIGRHVLTDPWAWAVAAATALGETLGHPFWVTLPTAGLAALLARRPGLRIAAGLLLMVVLLAGLVQVGETRRPRLEVPRWGLPHSTVPPLPGEAVGEPAIGRLFLSGLRAGLLTFGGAYTVLPFLRRDAVEVGRWMTDAQFLDGVALSGILPAPFIIFSTFVGFLGGGPLGALALTVGIFLPAFAITLTGHGALERLVDVAGVRTFLDGVSAGVVGLIATTALDLFVTGVRDLAGGMLFAVALVTLLLWQARAGVAAVVAAAGAAGLLLFR
ncbi:MAG: chromate efflux transporter [Armatimonadota bacterium]|nr:chromate efflux transporter [Armatimonadota bacterium]MDR7448897.1 chromate efflux transporter [Armatimonadota bacterium]MDR7460151.1 chromate efflux transporter [Armatimonadota bacterium]MDR7479223.1 chromate efflux transporter [Armatimonadota bacterium]MDR7487865.1 chromate efflux transporter [Armatimonadota bacterium]